MEEHGRGLYALLFKLTRSHDTADELLQELFIRLGQTEGRLIHFPDAELDPMWFDDPRETVNGWVVGQFELRGDQVGRASRPPLARRAK